MKDNEDWRQEYLEMKVHDQKSKQLLQAMYIDYKKRKGIRDPEPPNCQSSFKEFEDRINKSTINQQSINQDEK